MKKHSMKNIEVIERIEELMKQRGIKAIQLCFATGISTGNFSDWRRGRSVPSLQALIAIADYFDVSLDFLCGRTER